MSNAYTSLTNTNYHFDCSNEGFKDGLDRFAQFYISPTLNENSADKEIKAVDSEYNMSLSTDAWHFFNLVQHQSNPESSLHRFNCGNVTSLKKEGMRQQLLNFHKKYYSSNIMRLAISGRHDIETMEKWVNEMFSGIENKDVSVPDLGSPKPYLPENLGSLTRFVPIRDKDIMNLYFILPYTEKEYKT
jgi:insulysin